MKEHTITDHLLQVLTYSSSSVDAQAVDYLHRSNIIANAIKFLVIWTALRKNYSVRMNLHVS